MGKFINPFTDVGFKRIFGQEISKPVLIAFLNSLLEGERHVVTSSTLTRRKSAFTMEIAHLRRAVQD